MGQLALLVLVIGTSLGTANDISGDETYEWADLKMPSDVRALQLQSLSKVINRIPDPCDDFYGFACGNYANNSSMLQRSGPFNEKLIQEILLTGNYIPENEAEEKAMLYFNVCVADWPWNKSLVDVMVDVNRILKEHMTEEAFLWLEIEAYLTTINLPLFLDFRIIESRLRVELTTRWQFLGLNQNWTLSKYAEYTKSNLSFLNLEGSSLDDTSRNLDKDSLDMSNVNVTIEELSEILPFIDLKKYLGIVLGAEFNLSSKIEIVAPSSFQIIADFMNQMDPRQVLDFYRWHIADRLGRRLQGLSAPEDEIGETCYRNTYLTFKSAVLSIFKKVRFHPDSEQEIKDMFERIKEELRELVQEAFREDGDSRREALKKVEAITLEILFPSYILDEESLTEEYRHFQVDPSNFVRNSLSGSALHLQRNIKFISGQQSQADINWHDEHPLWADPFFEEKHKGIMYLSIGTLKAPFFHPYFYRFYNYGILGFIMGHEIMHGFDVDGITYDSNGLKRDWLKKELETAIAISSNCYREQYDNFTFLNHRIDGEATLNENIADHIGAVLALNAYENWLLDYEDTPTLEDERFGASKLGLTELQAFFISLGHFHCAHPQFQVQGENEDHAPESVRLTGLLSNSDEFSEVFTCPVNSRMNPLQKCKYF